MGLLVVLRYQDLSEMGKKFFISLVWIVFQRSNESMAHGADSHSSLEGVSSGFVVFACRKADLIRGMSISLIH